MSAPQAKRVGRLYLVPNTLDFGCAKEGAPLPDVQDVLPLGALAVAARLNHWVCENAKTTRALLKRIDIVTPLSTPLQALDIQVLARPGKKAGEDVRTDLTALLAPALSGQDMGLMSEAGLPGVADPGADLVLAAHGLGIPVLPLSGPSSLVLAIAAGGLNGQSFAFIGYLPVEAGQRAQRIRELEQSSRKLRQTQLVIETPYRNQTLMAALLEHLAPRTWLSVSCGLTLATGWSRTLRVAEWKAQKVTLPTDIPAVFSWLAG